MRRLVLTLIVLSHATNAFASDEGAKLLEEARQLRLAAWRASIAAPAETKNATDLAGIIQQIESVQLSPEAAPEPQTQPAEQPTAPAVQTQPTQPAVVDPMAALNNVDPGAIKNPLGLADGLYEQGHLAQAGRFYEAVLASDAQADSKAWALFQLANCKRQQDPDAARGLYQRLISEYPSCPWRPAAESRQQLIEWMGQHASDLTSRPPEGSAPSTAPNSQSIPTGQRPVALD
jgi:tetratricopeptide (TPR) repeat protein